MEKADIPKITFYKLLKGEGNLKKGIEKISALFGIKGTLYFYRKNFQPLETLEQKNQI